MFELFDAAEFNARSIGSMPEAVRSLLAAAFFARSGSSVVWLVRDDAEMYRLQDDLSCFVDPVNIELFYAHDVRPYQDDSPSREVCGGRIRVLDDLNNARAKIVLAPLRAVLPRTFGRQVLRASAISINPGDELDRDALAEELVRMGYERSPLIDDVGQFSMRGFVVDIFSPGMDDPVRIDLFGETVEDIRKFSLETQRSGARLGAARILPVSEILVTNANVKRVRPLLRRRSDERRDQIISDLEHGILPPGMEGYLPLFYEGGTCFFEYLPADALVIAPHAGELQEIVGEIVAEYARACEKAVANGRDPLPPAELLCGADEINAHIAKAQIAITDSIEGVRAPLACREMSLGRDAGSEKILEYLAGLLSEGLQVYLFVGNRMLGEKLIYALKAHGLDVAERDDYKVFAHERFAGGVVLIPRQLSGSVILAEKRFALISGDELFGSRRRKRRRTKGAPLLNPFTQLNVGDAVVHRDNGIGSFMGIERLELGGVRNDFVVLEYMGGDKLYVPVYRLNLLQRYIGDSDNLLTDRLGGPRWEKAKKKAHESVQKLAGELLEIYARRESARGCAFDTADAAIADFEAAFAYEETDDQLKAIEATYEDMASVRPMDRLVCGDVGYGKTEVALRAAFVAAMSGKQTALLVPTTLLARQHLKTFRERMDDWPVRIEALTSFSTSAANQAVREDLAEGRVDIVIGTHTLLGQKVKFKNLGLLVVDEEHKFGVKHKEKIKSLRSEVDILTLTATPIPRTLNMAISGIRDLSVIETPPVDRKSIDTEVARYDEDIIVQAVRRELDRGGQVYFVHNQVRTIRTMAEKLQAMLPDARIGVGHGQMPRGELNTVMERFVDRRINLLVCSAIISSGIDISTANTIIINRAERFGLADLYQLRGRVGRSKAKGYAVLLIPAAGQVSKDARKRLAAIKEYESLGAGFQMALRDMEIRGVGDILGKAQWGQVSAIGYELYQQMLKEAVDKLQGREPVVQSEPEINIGVDAYVPEDYCPDQHQRLGFYKRLSTAAAADLDDIRAEYEDLYGPSPASVRALFVIAEIRDGMRQKKIARIERGNNRLRLVFAHDTLIDLEKLIAMVEKTGGRLYPDGKADIFLENEDILAEIRHIMGALA